MRGCSVAYRLYGMIVLCVAIDLEEWEIVHRRCVYVLDHFDDNVIKNSLVV